MDTLTRDELDYLIHREGGPRPTGTSTRSLGVGLGALGAIDLRIKLERMRREIDEVHKQPSCWLEMRARDVLLSVRTRAALKIHLGDPTLGELNDMTNRQLYAECSLFTRKVLAELRGVIDDMKKAHP